MTRRVDKLHHMLVFSRVASLGSLAAASISLDLPASSVSKTISALERDLGLQLISRTTRALNLTDDGVVYLSHARRILAAVETMENEVGADRRGAAGLLRVTSPTAFGEAFLSAHLPNFCLRYPKIKLEFVAEWKQFELVSNDIDIAIRNLAPDQDTDFYSKQLLPLSNVLVASSDYLASAGVPVTHTDLAAHKLLAFKSSNKRASWKFMRRDKTFLVPVDADFISNSYLSIRLAAQAGLGIANMPLDYVLDDINSGVLRLVLPNYKQPRGNRVAIYRQKRSQSPKVDAFLNFLGDVTTPHKKILSAF